ncbi:MAG TPA: hypothetical protein PKM88_16355, partial [bacterium]|nr:hypothetical protein [bacterium]
MRNLLLLALLLALPLPAWAAFDPASWQYRRTLSLPDGAAFGVVTVDSAIHARTGARLDSLRVVADSQELPYALVSRPPHQAWETVTAVVHNATRDGSTLRVELDGGVPDRYHDRVNLTLTGGDYRVPVTVEGSRDRRQWQTL